MSTRIEEFDYSLPRELIAQHPPEDRSGSRLLVLRRSDGSIEHRSFPDVTAYLGEGDVLVLNDTKVVPARLFGRKATGGLVEILLVEKETESRWACLVKGLRPAPEPREISVGGVSVTLRKGAPFWSAEFPPAVVPADLMHRFGVMPVPPYVRRKPGEASSDFSRYQTVYAETPGSIAAPTAGFHFTGDLLGRLERAGVTVITLTLHIGVGTFQPVKVKTVEEHRMHSERYAVAGDLVDRILEARAAGRRIVACGTSVVRTLETVCSGKPGNGGAPLEGRTDLFIYPGYRFTVVDAMITNFHLPRSTPLLLVTALAGRERIMKCYEEAIARGYRFYSYGDAMLIL